jgi:hypothetical protein
LGAKNLCNRVATLGRNGFELSFESTNAVALDEDQRTEVEGGTERVLELISLCLRQGQRKQREEEENQDPHWRSVSHLGGDR